MAQTRSMAHLIWVFIVFGIAGLIFIGGGMEMLENGTLKVMQAWLTILAGLGMWGLIVFMVWMDIRRNRQRDWVARQNYPVFAEKALPKGGFLKVAGITWVCVLLVHMGTFLVAMADWFPMEVRSYAFLGMILVLPIAHVVVPLVVGLLWHMIRATATPKYEAPPRY